MSFLKYFLIGLFASPTLFTSASPALLTTVSPIEKRDNDEWHALIKEMFPENKEICDLISAKDPTAVHKSNAAQLMAWYFTDRKGDMDDWLFKLYSNVTIEQTSVGDLDCTLLGSTTCGGSGNGDCLESNPAAWSTILHQAATLHSVFNNILTDEIINATANIGQANAMVRAFIEQANNELKKQLAMAASATWLAAALVGMLAFIPAAGPLGIGITEATVQTAARTITQQEIARGVSRMGGVMAGRRFGTTMEKMTAVTAKFVTSVSRGFEKSLNKLLKSFNQFRTGQGQNGATNRQSAFVQNVLYLAGASIGVANNKLPDGTLDLDKIEGEITNVYSQFFRGIATQLKNVPPVLFGGKIWEDNNEQIMSPWSFAKSMNSELQNDTVQWHALAHIFGEPYFWDMGESVKTMQSVLEFAVGFVNFGILGQIFSSLEWFVASFSKYTTEDVCNDKMKGSGKWIDGKCYGIMRPPGEGANRRNPSYVRRAQPDLIKKAVDEFDLSLEDMIEAVATCNNNFDAIDMAPEDVDWDKMESAASCFWPLVYAPGSCLAYLGDDGDGSALKYHNMEYDTSDICGDTGCEERPKGDELCENDLIEEDLPSNQD